MRLSLYLQLSVIVCTLFNYWVCKVKKKHWHLCLCSSDALKSEVINYFVSRLSNPGAETAHQTVAEIKWLVETPALEGLCGD